MGKVFSQVTDHRPLKTIYGNPNFKPPLRIKTKLLRLQQYNITVACMSVKDNPADLISRQL